MLTSSGRVGGDKSSYVALVRSPATAAENCLIIGEEELGGAPSEGGIVASSSFSSLKEPRFIEPVGL